MSLNTETQTKTDTGSECADWAHMADMSDRVHNFVMHDGVHDFVMGGTTKVTRTVMHDVLK